MNLRDDHTAVPPGLPQKRPLCSAHHEAPDLGHGVSRIPIRSERLARLPEICSGRRLRQGTRTGSHRPPVLLAVAHPHGAVTALDMQLNRIYPNVLVLSSVFLFLRCFFACIVLRFRGGFAFDQRSEKGASTRTLPKTIRKTRRQRMPLSYGMPSALGAWLFLLVRASTTRDTI